MRLYDSAKAYLPPTLRHRISSMAWKALGLQWTLSSGSSIAIRCLADWRTYNEIFVDQDYDAAISSALDSHASGTPFNAVDLGANIGLFTMRVLHLASLRQQPAMPVHVVAVEGSPSVARDLRMALRDARLDAASSIDVIQGLAGQRSGQARFEESPFHVTNRATATTGDVVVDYVDLDHATRGLDTIDLLKCDIEGSEEAFVTNYPALLSRARVAVFEMHEQMCDTKGTIAKLQALGFRQAGYKRVGADCFLAWFKNERAAPSPENA